MAEQVKVKGLAELDKMLKELPAKMEANVLRAALRAGANVVRDEAKRTVPVDTGTLRDGIKVSTRSSRGTVTASIKTGGKHGYIAGWLEFGTAAHKILPKNAKALTAGGVVVKSVEHPGIPPRPFMRPALDLSAQKAVVAVGEAIKKRLTKAGLDASGVEIGGEE